MMGWMYSALSQSCKLWQIGEKIWSGSKIQNEVRRGKLENIFFGGPPFWIHYKGGNIRRVAAFPNFRHPTFTFAFHHSENFIRQWIAQRSLALNNTACKHEQFLTDGYTGSQLYKGNTWWWCGILFISRLLLPLSLSRATASINFRRMLPDKIVIFLDASVSLSALCKRRKAFAFRGPHVEREEWHFNRNRIIVSFKASFIQLDDFAVEPVRSS